MHEALLARAARPAPVIVLGLLLKPFSIGHYVLLIREGNPLAESNDASAVKVAEAALICSHNWQQNSTAAFDWLLGLKMWAWKRRIKKCLKPEIMAGELLKFIRYRNEGSLEFPLSEWPWPGRQKDNSGRPTGTPFALRLQQFLMLRFGKSELEAWNYPIGLAKQRWQCYWEEEGAMDVHNHIDEKQDQALREMEAKGKEALKNV